MTVCPSDAIPSPHERCLRAAAPDLTRTFPGELTRLWRTRDVARDPRLLRPYQRDLLLEARRRFSRALVKNTRGAERRAGKERRASSRASAVRAVRRAMDAAFVHLPADLRFVRDAETFCDAPLAVTCSFFGTADTGRARPPCDRASPEWMATPTWRLLAWWKTLASYE